MAKIFPALYGNTATKERLGRLLRNGRFPHALILSGPEGSGRRTLARAIAAALVCEGGEDLPCGVCENCRRVKEGIFPDLHVVAPDEGKSLIPVAKIREMRTEMSLSAVEAGRRIFIIENADAMNTAAQNALLISLEEPPDGVFILLIVESEEALLTTVRSRAQTVRTELFENDRLFRYLNQNKKFATLAENTPDRADALIEGAHGCIGAARSLLEGGGLSEVMKRREAVDAVIEALAERGTLPLYDAIHTLPTAKREELCEVLSLLSEALRDLILLKREPTAPMLYYTDREAALALMEKVGIGRLFALSDAAAAAIDDLAKNANVPIVLAGLMHAVAAH